MKQQPENRNGVAVSPSALGIVGTRLGPYESSPPSPDGENAGQTGKGVAIDVAVNVVPAGAGFSRAGRSEDDGSASMTICCNGFANRFMAPVAAAIRR